jgi:hypothetical protein
MQLSRRLNVAQRRAPTESKAPVQVIAPLGQRLEKYRKAQGAPQAGFIFVSRRKSADHASVNLNSLLKWQIRPKFKQEGIRWHGWHAFRRGLATNLHRPGVPEKPFRLSSGTRTFNDNEQLREVSTS